MKELNISKGVALIGVLMLHILFIDVYTPFPWIRYFGFLVVLFFIITGYEFSPSKVSILKDFRNYVLFPFIYILKYFLIISVTYTIILVSTGKCGIGDCVYGAVCEIFTKPVAEMLFKNGYATVSFKPVIFAGWLIRDYTLANLIMIPAVRLYNGGKFRKISAILSLLIISAVCYVFLPNLPFQLQAIPSFCAFMFMGYIVKSEKIYVKFLQLSKIKKVIIALVLFAICLLLCSQLEMNHIASGRFAMDDASFISWLFGMVLCAACIIPCLYGARALSFNDHLSSFFSMLGRNSADINWIHMLFAMSLFQVTGIQNGKCISEPTTIVPELFLQFLIAFVFSFVMSYLWVKVRKKFILFCLKHKKKNTLKAS